MKRCLPFVFVTSIATSAFGQDSSRAQALFDEGRRLMNEGHFAEACPKLAASQKLDPGAGTLMNLASCYDKNGQTASAWATFLEAAAASKAANHSDWEAAARNRAIKLEADVPRLVVIAPKDIAGLVVERDGQALDPAELGSAMPIDPGRHTLRAHAAGKKPWSTEIQIREPRAQVTIPPLENESAAPAGAEQNQPSAPLSAERNDTQRILGVVAAGTGLVSIGVGTFFGLKANSTNDDAVAKCNAQHQCPQSSLDLRDTASGQATASTIFFIAGGALIAAGAVLYLTAPHSEKPVQVTVGGPGIVMGGRF